MSRMIPPETLEEIRSRSDIATVIESFIPLRRQGNTLKALCPFHKEKTPSFVVNPQRQIFHCFGCGKGGDVFRFVMEYEKLDFISAVRMLARRAGVPLEHTGRSSDGHASQREMLFKINQEAARFYRQCLLERPEGEIARRYLAERALTERAGEDFMIGYAPDKWDALLKWAERKFKSALLEQAGLAVPSATQKDSRSQEPHRYDRFRNRLMFPIRDEQGRVIGFSGRSLASDDRGAKYVNTPETPVFQKSRVLYALDRARRAIADTGQVIICEGQIDVIQCHMAGFNNAVAAQGTAFTEDHARILRRYADNVMLVFDADSAGQNAALRAAEIFLQFGLAVRVAALPPKTDPDSILRQPDGPDIFRKILEQAAPLIAFQIAVLRQADDADTEAGRLRTSRAILEMIRKSPNAVQQSILLQEAATSLALPVDVLQRELRALPPAAAPRTPTPASDVTPPPARELALTEHLAAEPCLTDLVRRYLPLECITHPNCRRIIEMCGDAADRKCSLAALLPETAADDEPLMQFAARVLAAPPKITSEFATTRESVQNLILSLRSAAVQRRRQELQKILINTPPDTTGRERQALEEEYAELGYDVARLKNWETALEIM
jgi:DNA primase